MLNVAANASQKISVYSSADDEVITITGLEPRKAYEVVVTKDGFSVFEAQAELSNVILENEAKYASGYCKITTGSSYIYI